jgi:hypothetical protein
VHNEHPVDVAKFTGRDQSVVRDPYPMQGTIEVVAPESEEFLQLGEARMDVVVLPHERLEEARMVGQAVKDLGRGETEPLDLPKKRLINLSGLSGRWHGVSL